jgi:tetratricopeptide (TPR) repeat protein
VAFLDAQWNRFHFLAVSMCLISSAQINPAPPVLAEQLTDRIHQAVRYLKSGEVEKASLEVQRLLDEDPTSGEAYNLLGQIRIRQILLAQAEECFRKAIQLSPQLRDAYENLAFLELLQHKDRAAATAAEKLLQLDSANYNGHLIAGITSYNEGRYEDSAHHLLPLAKGEGDHDALVLAVSVEACRKLERNDEAEHLVSRLGQLKVAPNDAILAARLLDGKEFRSRVLRWLLSAQQEGGNSYELLYQLGIAYLRADEPESARQYLLEALSKKPSDPTTLIKLTAVEDHLGDKQAALDHFMQAKRAPKTSYPTLISYALACIQKRMFIDARQALETAVRLQPEDEVGHYLLGVSAYGLQNYALAETELRVALARQPMYPAARLALGVALLARGRIDEAADIFRGVLSADPSSGAAHYYLAQVYRRRGKTVEARAELQDAIHLDPDDARPYADLAGLDNSEDRLTQASDLLTRALALNPQSSKAHYERGVLFRKQGKLAQAKEEFDLSRKLNEEEAQNAVVLLVTKGSTDHDLAFSPNR